MEVATKYNPGDTVYLMEDNKIKKATIYSITIHLTLKGVYKQYWINVEYNPIEDQMFEEQYLFESIEELKRNL